MSAFLNNDRHKPIDIREPAISLLQAELLASSPDQVFQWLKARKAPDKAALPDYDDEVENALLVRNDPLINLGLARYGVAEKTVYSLFHSTDTLQRKALRLAVLANQTVHDHCGYRSGDLIEALISYKGDVGEFLTSLSHEELRALFLNPTLSDRFLENFLEQKEGWRELDEARQRFIVTTLAHNPRMSAVYESVHMDGYAESIHSSVFDAAWNLARWVPVTVQWCWALQRLYSNTTASAFSVKDPLELAKRWVPDPADSEAQRLEQNRNDHGGLGPYGYVRQQLARLSLEGSSGNLKSLLAHEDLAVRMGAYRYGNLRDADIESALARDPQFAFDELVRNEYLWRTAKTRDLLRKLAWAQPDPSHDMLAPNAYNYTEAEFREKYPKWFADEDREPVDEEQLPVTRGEFKQAMDELAAKIELTYPTLGTIQNAVAGLLRRGGWLVWAIILFLVLWMIHSAHVF